MSHADWVSITSKVARLSFDPSVGNIPSLCFTWGGGTLSPLHRAAWTDDLNALATEDVPLVDRKLAGDFVCAPFGKSDVEPSPPHGWTANSGWDVTDSGKGTLEATLKRQIMGACISKSLRLAEDAPLLYQTHTIHGGAGGLTFAHHPMVDVSGGARLFTSPKCLAVTSEFAIVPGKNTFALAAETNTLQRVPGSDGSVIDVTNLPIAKDREDFVALIEEAQSGLGWTAILRKREQDIVFVLKDVTQLPLTMLWHSNGARTDFPWNGRNRGVLGIEDGRCAGGSGHAASLQDNRFTELGIPTAFELSGGRAHTIYHVIGSIPWPSGWTLVSAIRVSGSELIIEGSADQAVRLSFAHDFFETNQDA